MDAQTRSGSGSQAVRRDAGAGRDARRGRAGWSSTVKAGDVVEIEVDGRFVRLAVEAGRGRRMALRITAPNAVLPEIRKVAKGDAA